MRILTEDRHDLKTTAVPDGRRRMRLPPVVHANGSRDPIFIPPSPMQKGRPGVPDGLERFDFCLFPRYLCSALLTTA
jgi:hypothetical protein